MIPAISCHKVYCDFQREMVVPCWSTKMDGTLLGVMMLSHSGEPGSIIDSPLIAS
ncbi:Uncharacterised protein [Mycobacteroides abscessus]|nr:Uncharacterised protein [Mycobacteroides abscessus]CPY98374.1 Uncharacterised protein [Mycobacteroides abscessus]